MGRGLQPSLLSERRAAGRPYVARLVVQEAVAHGDPVEQTLVMLSQAVSWRPFWDDGMFVLHDVDGYSSVEEMCAKGDVNVVYVATPNELHAEHTIIAAEHGKPMSFPEWGLYDYGDDPSYVRAMYAWIAEHDVVYQTITDYCQHGVWDCHENPASSRVYRQLFGQRAGP